MYRRGHINTKYLHSEAVSSVCASGGGDGRWGGRQFFPPNNNILSLSIYLSLSRALSLSPSLPLPPSLSLALSLHIYICYLLYANFFCGSSWLSGGPSGFW
jgi:hypothetical protein